MAACGHKCKLRIVGFGLLKQGKEGRRHSLRAILESCAFRHRLFVRSSMHDVQVPGMILGKAAWTLW